MIAQLAPDRERWRQLVETATLHDDDDDDDDDSCGEWIVKQQRIIYDRGRHFSN